MLKTLKTITFFFLVPFLAAVGYDIYNNFIVNSDNAAKLENLTLDPAMVKPMDFGYFLTQNLPELYTAARDAIDPVTWTKYIDPVLGQYTTVLTLIPILILCSIMSAISLIAKVQQKLGSTGHLKSYHSGHRDKGKGFEYKRK